MLITGGLRAGHSDCELLLTVVGQVQRIKLDHDFIGKNQQTHFLTLL